MRMIRSRAAAALLPLFFIGTVAAAGSADNSADNSYPTQDRVEYVFQCMDSLGGKNYTNLYKCSCTIDRIATEVSYDEYLAMQTFDRGRQAGGERPELIREGKMASQYRRAFAQVRNNANESCGIDQTFSAR